MTRQKIVIGTRGSALALTQAKWVGSRLMERHTDLDVVLEIIKTKGDKILDVPLAKVGGKGLFVKEIEDALSDGRVDLAVHSMKDVPSEQPEGLFIAVIPKREDHRDALVSRQKIPFSQLPQGARVGTSSLRRQSQLLKARPDLRVETLRGNLDTRLKKLESEKLDAIIVAAAGLKRMGLFDRATEFLSAEIMVPAVGQGALGLEVRDGDPDLLERISFLYHRPSALCVGAERAFLNKMGGGCQVPLGALARLDGDRLHMTAMVASPDGTRFFREAREARAAEAEKIGRELADELLARGGREILAEVYEEAEAGK